MLHVSFHAVFLPTFNTVAELQLRVLLTDMVRIAAPQEGSGTL